MIANSHRSGVVRVERGEDRQKPQSDVRSGRSSEGEPVDERQQLNLRRQKIVEVDGELRLIDA
jgi:hypothetical protein